MANRSVRKAAPTKKAAVEADVPAPTKKVALRGKNAVPAKRTAPKNAKPQVAKRPKTANAVPSKRLHVLVCGTGEFGELGLGPKEYKEQAPTCAKRPRLNHLLSSETVGVVQIAAGGMHCAALTYDGEILTWGVNDDGALGRDSNAEDDDLDSEDDEYGLLPQESTPIAVPKKSFPNSLSQFSQIVAIDSATFALTSDGFVYGWGTFKGPEGTIGFSKETSLRNMEIQRIPTRIPQLSNIKMLAASGNHVLALHHDGRLWTWGCAQQSQLGRRINRRTAKRNQLNFLEPERLGLKNIVSIACGFFHSFAIDGEGDVYAWGLNNFGQTGISSGTEEPEALIEQPTVVRSLQPYRIKEIRGGNHHSIACTVDGDVLIWGRCDDAQIGIPLDQLPRENLVFNDRGQPRILTMPTKVPGIQAVSVTAGIDSSIAVGRDGTAVSWGFSENYRTGLGTEVSVVQPKRMESGDLKGKKITFAGCGGQFSVLAGSTP